jgi:para-nitrobenzyl esterase
MVLPVKIDFGVNAFARAPLFIPITVGSAMSNQACANYKMPRWLLGLVLICWHWAGLYAQDQSINALLPAGQWYDRAHSGHGLDLNRASGQVFGAFYTYAADGRPEWLWVQFPDAEAGAGVLKRFVKEGATLRAESVGNFSLRAVAACADGVPRIGARQLLEFRFDRAEGVGVWCLEPLLPQQSSSAAYTALDGHWYLPGDSGWGLVTHYFATATGTGAFHMLHFHDGSGFPRWALANANVSGFVQPLAFYTVRGSCFGCAASQLSEAPIGTAELTLRSTQPGAGNSIRIDLRFDANSQFVRDAEPRLLSQPRALASVRASAQGLVRGALQADETTRFSAIPYAKPPLAQLRWRAPQKALARAQVFDATSVGPGCLQPSGQALFTGAPAAQSEDCLQLNVWQPPARLGVAGLPVMVWIHGGGLTIGSAVEQIGSRLVYDGGAFAKKGVVLVSINYRLGPFGYLSLRGANNEAPDHTSAGNYGLLDQIAALEWVQTNIAQFGGDPNNVTIFGESAGGVSACALLAAPAARGLFARVIAQSGNCLRAPSTIEAAFNQGDRVQANAGCHNAVTPVAALSCMRGLNAEALLQAGRAGVNLGVTPSGLESYGLSVDGFSLRESPATAVSSARAAQVPLLLGVNDDESTSTNPSATLPSTTANYEAQIRSQFPTISAQVLARYPAQNYETPQRAYQDLLDDVRFVCANRRAALDHAAFGQPVFHYALTDVLADATLAPLESFHGLDITYLFARNTSTVTAAELNLREKMQNAWIAFARVGDPGGALGYPWPRYRQTRQSAELNHAALGPPSSTVPSKKPANFPFFTQ